MDAGPGHLEVHLVPHTHWDREWYEPAVRFRQRLVPLVDELLDRRDPAPPSFLLDGQTVVLEDYLAVRPERAAELGAQLRAGGLEAGPWFVLADELIPSSEALVRNLLAGRRTLRALRATAPPVLYCPDSFGHPAALPMLAREFGCELIILWRGYGGDRWPPGDTVLWCAPDGAGVPVHHLSRAGYGLGANLPTGDGAARDRWRSIRAELAPRSRLGVVIVLNGADHHALQRDFSDAATALGRVAEPDVVRVSSLSSFAESVSRRAQAADIPEVAGELRDSYGYTWTLQGTFSARAQQKRRNAIVERLLIREAEPWSALAALSGGMRRRALLSIAWRSLLLCHPHDTLCGCASDGVARAMESRLDDAQAQAAGIARDARLELLGHDEDSARENVDRWRPVLVVRNPAARERGGVAEIELLDFVQHIPVGPGSGTVPALSALPRRLSIEGGAVRIQSLGKATLRHDRVEAPRHYPDDDIVRVARAVAWIPPMPGYGIRSLAIGRPAAPPHAPGPDVKASAGELANDHVRVRVGDDGRVSFAGLAAAGERAGAEHASGNTGREIRSLLSFEDTPERGDLYTHSVGGRAVTVARADSSRVVHSGPLRGTLDTRWRIPLAGRESGDGGRTMPARSRRARVGAPGTTVAVRLTLDAGAPVLRISVRGDNTHPGHRLRLLVATGLAGGDVYADAAFGPIRRVQLDVPAVDRAMEIPAPTAPLHRYVSLFAPVAGVTVFSDGLAEYEVTPAGEVAITIFRGVDQLSRNDLPERPGHAGWPMNTPDAECLGPFAAELAFMLHGARDSATIDSIERAADDFLHPLAGETLRSTLGAMGAGGAGGAGGA
ncbi:MAG: glycoside hydrolase family 38 C-terminal domain-containing protein, partial [Gemmatimonadaceae bacterium]